jgi:hypothetical protein
MAIPKDPFSSYSGFLRKYARYNRDEPIFNPVLAHPGQTKKQPNRSDDAGCKY